MHLVHLLSNPNIVSSMFKSKKRLNDYKLRIQIDIVRMLIGLHQITNILHRV